MACRGARWNDAALWVAFAVVSRRQWVGRCADGRQARSRRRRSRCSPPVEVSLRLVTASPAPTPARVEPATDGTEADRASRAATSGEARRRARVRPRPTSRPKPTSSPRHVRHSGTGSDTVVRTVALARWQCRGRVHVGSCVELEDVEPGGRLSRSTRWTAGRERGRGQVRQQLQRGADEGPLRAAESRAARARSTTSQGTTTELSTDVAPRPTRVLSMTSKRGDPHQARPEHVQRHQAAPARR